ncbi:hypothetical protein BH23ACT11_BH23ACT11_08410 [soil metagenome]
MSDADSPPTVDNLCVAARDVKDSKMDATHSAPGPHHITCPICECGELISLRGDCARCGECHCLVGGEILTTLSQLHSLPEAFGDHACECGHPEMRQLPDGVFRCPSCGSEVLPVTSPTNPWEDCRSEAYWSGWMDGRFHEGRDYANNTRLAEYESVQERLDFYRGHRAGHEARGTRRRRALKNS